MKTILYLTLALFFFFGCAKQEPTQMTPQDQETAKKEISEGVKVIIQNLEKMNAEALFQSYSNSPYFMFLTTDGSMVGLQEAKNHHAAWFKSLSSLKVTTIKDEFRFLPGNIVICGWQGKFELTIGSGQLLKIDKFGITFIFSKIDNQWKVIHQHSSALPPVPELSKQ
ncbi:MAG: nuclear transport factor 2 family protein [Ignavibacteriaceae bacterium]|nr:nuclear transport factor 2 family protein [Ignavibacteriaceae bacterium]